MGCRNVHRQKNYKGSSTNLSPDPDKGRKVLHLINNQMFSNVGFREVRTGNLEDKPYDWRLIYCYDEQNISSKVFFSEMEKLLEQVHRAECPLIYIAVCHKVNWHLFEVQEYEYEKEKQIILHCRLWS